MGPVLFSLFIRPLYEIEDLVTYSDDNNVDEENPILKKAIARVTAKTEAVIMNTYKNIYDLTRVFCSLFSTNIEE